MGEKFTMMFKDGSSMEINYPKDSLNLLKMARMQKATIGNIINITGEGKVAKTLRKRYNLTNEQESSTLDLLASTSGLSKEKILEKKEQVTQNLEKLKRRLH